MSGGKIGVINMKLNIEEKKIIKRVMEAVANCKYSGGYTCNMIRALSPRETLIKKYTSFFDKDMNEEWFSDIKPKKAGLSYYIKYRKKKKQVRLLALEFFLQCYEEVVNESIRTRDNKPK